MSIELIVIIAVVVILLIAVIAIYNRLVKMRENVKEAFKAISIALEERLRTVGGVIETAKKYMDFESDTLKQITAARTGLADALKGQNAQKVAEASEKLQSAFSGLNVQVENYPDLKSSSLMSNAQQSFAETAQKIAANQNYFNGTVREYNKQIKVFPNSIFASVFNFKEETYYEAGESTQTAVNDADLNRSLNF